MINGFPVSLDLHALHDDQAYARINPKTTTKTFDCTQHRLTVDCYS
jgi:hypothetical protein